MNLNPEASCSLADLDDFHRVNTFRRFLRNEATHASVLHFQAGMLLTGQRQQVHEILIDKDILLVPKYPELQKTYKGSFCGHITKTAGH